PWAAYVSVALWAASGIPSAIANNAWYGVLAEAVSPRRRPVVNGARWALLGFVSALCVALFGRTLDLLPFPLGYQLVFMVSAVGGAVGIWFYSRIEIPDREPRPPGAAQGWRARLAAIVGPLREGGEFLHYTIGTSVLRIGLRSTVGNVALTGGYYAWGRLAGRLGHRRTLGFAAGGLALYPALTAASPSVEWLLPAAFIWGLFASGIDMRLFEGLLEVCPTDRRAEFVAVNTFVANAIVFVAPILGASLADLFGIRPVLYLAAALHLAAV